MLIRRGLALAVLVAAAFCPAVARAADRFISIPLTELPGIGKELLSPEGSKTEGRTDLFPRVAVDGAGEGYLKIGTDINPYWSAAEVVKDARLTLRLTNEGDVKGNLYLPNADLKGQTMVPFTITVAQQKPSDEARKDFLQGKQRYYHFLGEGNLPGGAWFRHREKAAADALDKDKLELNSIRRGASSDDTSEFDIFSGGLALAENLQLDRALRGPDSPNPPVDIGTLEGITVKQFDWAALVKDLHPALDPLAAVIPADQHAIFFADAKGLSAFITEAGRSMVPVLGAFDQNTSDDRIADMYSRQLCLPLGELDTALPADLLGSVAVTGSDPSLRTGTGVTLLLEAKANSGATLYDKVRALLTGRAPKGSVKELGKTIQGMTPDRSVNFYLARMDDVVVVSNSPQQIDAVTKTQAKTIPSLASLPEYVFYRNRYPRGDKDETAFVMISDATIRRWCGPKARIASAQRMRAAAMLAEFEAASLEDPSAKLEAPESLNLGELKRVDGHVQSARFNTLAFLTPAEELDLSKVSAADAEAYKRWRDSYQQDWKGYFDPIGLRLSLGKDKVAMDLSVMPLIEKSAYAEGMFKYFQGKFAADAADPHGALFHEVSGLDASKPPLADLLPTILPLPGMQKAMNPFQWLGNYTALYADDDPFWGELAKAEKAEDFLEKNWGRLPIAFQVGVSNQLGEAAFLTAVRSFVESSAPGMVKYTLLKYNDQAYVKVTASEEVGLGQAIVIYYVPFSDSLLLTLNEPLLKRAIDRRVAGKDAAAGATAKPEETGWLGKTTAVHLDGGLLRLALRAMDVENLATAQKTTWNMLPVLNDIRMLHPGEDAVAIYSRAFHAAPVDALDEPYIWDEKHHTYASKSLGSPAAPLTAYKVPAALETLQGIDFGITLEDNNLRGRVVLRRSAGEPQAAPGH